MNKLDIYYKINNDLISHYNMNKRNFHKLTNLNFLKKYNEQIIKDFNDIINTDNIFELYEFIFVNFYDANENYIGEMKNGLWEGKGLLYFPKNDESNRKKYEGEFKNGKMEGKGKLYYNNGARYEGEFRNNYRKGKGIIYYTNGNKYEGEFEKDQKVNTQKDIKAKSCDKQDEINEKCYDVIVLGTGLKESILASLLAKYPEIEKDADIRVPIKNDINFIKKMYKQKMEQNSKLIKDLNFNNKRIISQLNKRMENQI